MRARRPAADAAMVPAALLLALLVALAGCVTGRAPRGDTRADDAAAARGHVATPVATPVAVESALRPASAPTLDHERYRRAAARLRRFDAGGAISHVHWSDEGRTLSFERLGRPYRFDLETRLLVEPEGGEADEGDRGATPQRRRGGRPARGRQRDREPSPDGAWTAVCRDWNVVLEPAESGEDAAEAGDDGEAGEDHAAADDAAPRESVPVTTDGTRKLRYGTASWVYGEELDQRDAMWWSPDSRRLVFYAFDERAVADYYLLEGLTERHTSPLVEGYPKPGEPNPTASLLVYDIESGATRPLLGPTPEGEEGEWYLYDVRFAPDGRRLLVNRTNRRQDVLHVDAVDVETGLVQRVVTERSPTWQDNRPEMRFLADGERFIWATERSGWRQLELRHLDGRLLVPLTRGSFPVVAIEKLVEEGPGPGVLYYTACGGECPLDAHLYRVNLDGTDQRRLTREEANHTVSISPDARWFVTRYETVTRPPTTALYDTEGTRVATLARSEPERIAHLLGREGAGGAGGGGSGEDAGDAKERDDEDGGAAGPDAADPPGYPPPERFSFTASDGETVLYGWLHRPRGFDPTRSYPLVIAVYGGPSSQSVRDVYRPGHPGTEYGFLVAMVDNRGTDGRGRAFRDATYLKLGTVDLQDQADAVRHLARRPYVDGARVGIYGHSYGGYMAALAVLRYPDVFRVAVAASPVTDWRNYDTIYTERYMRTPAENEEGYDAASCLTRAADLEGRLLLLHGMRDDNVHPSNTFQLAEALDEAHKPFEMMIYPNSGHGLPRDAEERRWEYLYRWLVEK